ncbi:hypothetical protein CFIMG_001024RA [Ceratocystis fimbriata CBS 114723]|uniref:Uncharacterized protein n=1 Tax=Ceratocystis fimbriata CBS 114723 TaxID=1035309 RepID=A0A2C5X8R7_9PEZI|nr:hypothetical protein CFIMG_001024RA [Ceratocystis fimbriata CBS 114723]
MKLLLLSFASLAALGSLGGVLASPIVCPDDLRDLILSGQVPEEVCCSYGVCRGNVVIRMM